MIVEKLNKVLDYLRGADVAISKNENWPNYEPTQKDGRLNPQGGWRWKKRRDGTVNADYFSDSILGDIHPYGWAGGYVTYALVPLPFPRKAGTKIQGSYTGYLGSGLGVQCGTLNSMIVPDTLSCHILGSQNVRTINRLTISVVYEYILVRKS